MKKEIVITFMSGQKGIPMGMYAHKEPNIFYPVVYFRKAKHANKKEYEIILEYIKNNTTSKLKN